MHHYNQHDKIRLVGAVTVAILLGLFAGGTRARAQSLDDSSARAGDSAPVGDALAPSVKSLIIDAAGAPAASDDSITANAVDYSVTPPVPDNSGVAYAPPGNVPASDEASGFASENNSVLELPQVLNLQNGSGADTPVDEASANPDDNDDDNALSSQDTENTDSGSDLAAIGSPVGTLADYQNQANEMLPGAIFLAPPVTVVRFPRPPLFNTQPRPPFGLPMVAPPIILPPTSSGPFPSTSPMLMGPRPGTFGLFPRGGLIGAHR